MPPIMALSFAELVECNYEVYRPMFVFFILSMIHVLDKVFLGDVAGISTGRHSWGKGEHGQARTGTDEHGQIQRRRQTGTEWSSVRCVPSTEVLGYFLSSPLGTWERAGTKEG